MMNCDQIVSRYSNVSRLPPLQLTTYAYNPNASHQHLSLPHNHDSPQTNTFMCIDVVFFCRSPSEAFEHPAVRVCITNGVGKVTSSMCPSGSPIPGHISTISPPMAWVPLDVNHISLTRRHRQLCQSPPYQKQTHRLHSRCRSRAALLSAQWHRDAASFFRPFSSTLPPPP